MVLPLGEVEAGGMTGPSSAVAALARVLGAEAAVDSELPDAT